MSCKIFLHGISELINKVLFIFLWFTRSFRPLRETTDSVLLVRCAHIGDFVLWLDSAQAFRTLYPSKKLVFLTYTYKDVSEIAEKTGYFDEVRVLDSGWRKRVTSIRILMHERYDVVINANPSRSLQSDLFALAPRSGERIAPESDLTMISPRWLRWSDRAYTRIIYCEKIKTMELIRNAQFMRGLGVEKFRASLPVLPVSTKWEKPAKHYFAVCPGADNLAKCWPAEKFAEMADRLVEETGLTCILLGAEKEKPIGNRILTAMRYKEHCISLMGKTSLPTYIEAIKDADFLISSDTSAGHIAAAVRTLAIVIDSGWDRGRFYPYTTETEDDKPFLPFSVVPDFDCLGCGENPSVTKNLDCMTDGVMKCVAAVTVKQVYLAWKNSIDYFSS